MRLPKHADLIYLTRQVAARISGVHDYTIDRYCEPDAWRRNLDGTYHPLYAESTVEAFRASYRDGRVPGGAE